MSKNDIICQKCDKTFKHAQTLAQHNASIHEKKMFKCDQCDYQCTRTENLNAHIRHDHEMIPYKNICTICEKSYKESRDLKLHVMVIHEGKYLKCEDCDAQFSSVSGVRRHKREVHDQIPIKCSHCDFSCLKANDLRKHKESMHTNTDFKCCDCDFETNKYHSLNWHIKSVYKISKSRIRG